LKPVHLLEQGVEPLRKKREKEEKGGEYLFQVLSHQRRDAVLYSLILLTVSRRRRGEGGKGKREREHTLLRQRGLRVGDYLVGSLSKKKKRKKPAIIADLDVLSDRSTNLGRSNLRLSSQEGNGKTKGGKKKKNNEPLLPSLLY